MLISATQTASGTVAPMSEATAAASNDDWSTYTREYRIMQTDADTWEVREVYFDEAGKVVAWTGHAARLWGGQRIRPARRRPGQA